MNDEPLFETPFHCFAPGDLPLEITHFWPVGWQAGIDEEGFVYMEIEL